MINEIRIGNLVTFLHEPSPRVVEGISKRLRPDVGYYELEGIEVPMKGIHISPIPLTEKWLVKFGFEIQSDSINDTVWCFYEKNNTSICLSTISSGMFWGVSFKEIYLIDIEFVHQLQNLYLDLTKEELIYKT